MKITCSNCNEVISKYLCDIPSAWREQMVKVICDKIAATDDDCDKFKECETVTKLSAFSVSGGEVCITYTDEDGVEFTRCFTIENTLNSVLDDIDPMCIASQEDWDSWTYKERIQAIVTFACTCGEEEEV